MDEIEGLLSIGTFARRVGLAPSALRFYDDCGVLRPTRVDATTGYRYYDADQEPRAVLVRRLREAGLPLMDASQVLDGTAEEARDVLEKHARRTRATAAAAQSAIDGILSDLPLGRRRAQALVGGAELSSAVRQVAFSVATAATRESFPELGCVLLELGHQEIRLVATDRHRMAVRVLRPHPQPFVCEPCQLLIDLADLKDAASWALSQALVTVEVDGSVVRMRGEGEVRLLNAFDGVFPDYRMVLEGLAAAQHRLVIDREALRRTLAISPPGETIILHTNEQQRLVLSSAGPSPLPEAGGLRAICTGPPLRIAFDPAVLLPALDASVGPDVLVEISSAMEPVVVRSADQGSFTTLVMPVHDTVSDD
ncbi:MerR family transcriptional regulator [Streptomyces sp. NPDC005953]|uniref:DNA polymerase III subunit beta family protein n=1 Tax=Streptomyces sp. NPDC005953 TaxID=3156719 RepID=UPI0033C6B2FF